MTQTHIEPDASADRSSALNAPAVSPIASMTLARCTSSAQVRGLLDSIAVTKRIAAGVFPSFAYT
jgi:hypothetical protein